MTLALLVFSLSQAFLGVSVTFNGHHNYVLVTDTPVEDWEGPYLGSFVKSVARVLPSNQIKMSLSGERF